MSSTNYPTTGVYEDGRSNLFERITDAWRDMRHSTHRLVLEDPSEARLFFYVLMSDMIFFLSWSAKTVLSPTASASGRLPEEVGLWLIVALACRSLAMYVFSILLGCGARVLGGQGSWRDTRLAVFWGALVAAPFGFFFALVTVLLASLEHQVPFLGKDAIMLAPYWMSLVPFVWFISAGLAEVHSFKRTHTVFAGMALIAIAVCFAALFFKARGLF